MFSLESPMKPRWIESKIPWSPMKSNELLLESSSNPTKSHEKSQHIPLIPIRPMKSLFVKVKFPAFDGSASLRSWSHSEVKIHSTAASTVEQRLGERWLSWWVTSYNNSYKYVYIYIYVYMASIHSWDIPQIYWYIYIYMFFLEYSISGWWFQPLWKI